MENKYKIFLGTLFLLIGFFGILNDMSYTGEAFRSDIFSRANIKNACPISSGNGNLIINSNPSEAHIYINDENKNVLTSETLILSAGTYKLKLTKSGYDDYLKNVCVLKNKNNKINARLKIKPPTNSRNLQSNTNFGDIQKGNITINSNPNRAEIKLRRNVQGNTILYTGLTPKTFKNIAIGNYKLTLKKEGYEDHEENVNIRKDQVTNLEISLKQINELYVSKDGDDINPGSKNLPFKTIQHAINNAEEGTTIRINQGRYNEIVEINKSVKLIGSGDTIIAKKTNSFNIPIIKIQNAQQVTVKDLSVSGIDSLNDYTGSSPRGIYVENTNIDLDNIKLYAFRNVYLNLYRINDFKIKNVKLLSSETGSFVNSDLGISIADSQGIIDGLENMNNNIDHVIDRTGNIVLLSGNSITLTDTKTLTIKNSIIRSRNFNYGDGIRYIGNGNNLLIENNQFIGYDGLMLATSTNNAMLPPNAISIANVNAEIKNNRINGYNTGIFIQGLTNVIKAENNVIINNAVGVKTTDNGDSVNFNLDFGGGNQLSNGGNQLNNNLYNIYYPRPTRQIFYAKNNDWTTQDNNQIIQKIYDKQDNPNLGEVQYQPIN